MSTLNAIKTRRSAVTTIRKITKAMEMIATSKLRKSRSNFENVKTYSQKIEEVFFELYLRIKSWNEIIKIDSSKPKLFIVISSDLGLCGAYNNNVVKLLKKNVQQNDKIIIFGSRGIAAFKNTSYYNQVLMEFDSVGDNPNYELVEKAILQSYSLLMNQEIGSINIIYTEFINSITFNAVNKRIFPFSKSKKEEYLKNNKINLSIEFEPDPENVVRKSLPLYLSALLYSNLAESKVSEMMSRKVSMENSSDNALDIIHDLDNEYNKQRQSKITQEIVEIIAGVQNE